MTFNKLYSTLQKARQSSKIIFHSSLSTSCVSEDLSKGRKDIFDITLTINEKCRASIIQRPCRAFISNHRNIHISTCKQFSITEKEKNESDKNVDEPLASIQNEKSKVSKSKPAFYKKRCFYKIRHKNLVWDGSIKQNRLRTYRMCPSINDRNKEFGEEMIIKTHNLNSELKSEKENPEVLKTQESSAKKVLTIDIFPHSGNNRSQFKVEDNINNSSKIDYKITTGIKNSGKLISSKEVKNRKIGNDYALMTKSTINDFNKLNSTILKKNKIPVNGNILKKKYKPNKEIKNILEQENYTDKKSTDDSMAFKMTKNSLRNQNSKEMIQKENSNYSYANKPKLDIFENKDNSDHRKNISTDGRKITVWNNINKQLQPQLASNKSLHLIKLQNKILSDDKSVNLNKKYKIASSVNNILRPVASQILMPREKYGYQFLSKNINSPIVSSVNSHQNITQQMCQSNNLVTDSTLHLKLLKIGNAQVNERSQNSNINYPLLNVSRDKIQNKIKLIKDIHFANCNKKVMVARLKCEIKSWKKCKHIKKVVLESTSRIYRSIMDRRRTGKIKKNTIYTPKKKYKAISVPLTPNLDINKCQKINHTQKKTNYLDNQIRFSTPDPIMTLNLKYKKNHQAKYNDLLKRNLISIYQEQFKKNLGILNYDSNKEFQIENKSGVKDNIKEEIFKRNNFNKPDDKVKILMEKAKKVSLEKKSSWVRNMHQMNDESKQDSLKITEISAYPSGCLKKPEFIIESLPFEEGHFEEMKQIMQSSISDSQTNAGNFKNITKENNSKNISELIPKQFNDINENLDSTNNEELTNKFKHNKIGLSKIELESLCDSKHSISEQKCTVAKKKHLNRKNPSILYSSPLDLEHNLFDESFEEIGAKENTNDKINHLSKSTEKVTKAGSEKPPNVNNSAEFQTKENFDSKLLNKMKDENTFMPEDDQFVSNNIYKPPIRNIQNNKVLKENKPLVGDEQHPEFTISSICIEENTPSENSSIVQNQSEYLRTDPSRQIKSIPMKKNAIEIFFDSSQSYSPVFKGDNTSKETSSNPEYKNNMELYNNYNNQKNPCEIQKMDEFEKVNNFCNSEQFSKEIKLKQSSFDQNVSNSNNHLEYVKNTQAEILGEVNTSSKDTNKKGLTDKVNASLPILSCNEKFPKENLSSLESKKIQQNENVELKHFQKTLNYFKHSNSYKIEDINEFKAFSNLKKSYPDIYCSNDNKKTFINNIKEFFRTSCSYFKLFSPEREASKNIISNSHHSMAKDTFHSMNYDVSNSLRDLNSNSKQTLSFPENGKPIYISSMCSKPDFHQKVINCNERGNEIEVRPHLTMHRKEGTTLNENEEFKSRFSVKSPAHQKDDFSLTCKNLENIPKDDSSNNHLDSGKNDSNVHYKNAITNTGNNLGKNNHHDSFLNKIIDKNFESFSVNQVTQQGSFCNINRKKSYTSKNRLYNQKLKQKFPKVKLNNIKNKLNEFHYSMNSNLPTEGISNSVNNRRYIKNEQTPFDCKIGQKPIMKNSTKFKKDYNSKLYSDVTTKPRIPDQSNLLKSYQSIKKLRYKGNPESFWSNSLPKNICTEEKLTCDEFLAYIKKRKLPRKPSFKCN